MINKRRLLVFIVVAGLGLTACSMQFNTRIKPDGSGEFTMEMTVNDIDILYIEAEEDQSLEEIMMDEFETTDKKTACELLTEDGDFPFPATVKYKEKGREYICEISMQFSNLDELVEIYDEMFYGMTGNVRMDEFGELNYAIGIDSGDFATADELGVAQVEYLWSVSAPGNIDIHNADTKRGNKLIWELQPQAFQNIEVISTPKGIGGFSFDGLSDGFSLWWLVIPALACLVFAGVIIIGGIAYLLLRRK